MNNINWKILEEHKVTLRDLYEGAFQIKMKAEQLEREGKDNASLYESEYRIISALAEMGDSLSMLLLGEMLQGGKVPELSMENPVRRAMELWQEAAENGEGRGYTNIGLVYLHRSVPGGGEDYGDVPYDPAKALACFHKAYDNGDSKAGRHIGLCYRDGIGSEPDDEKAYEWFCKAAERNDSTALYLKAECLFNGTGVDADREQCLKIMNKLVSDHAHDADKAQEFMAKYYR